MMSATTVLASLVAAATAAVAVTLPASDSDLFWHLASGDWMLVHGRLLDHDVFSFTRAGQPYASGQWLGQILLALAFRGGGWVGIEVLRAVLVGFCAFFITRATLRLRPHPFWALPPVLLALLVTKITWGDRPQLFTLALFALLLDLLLAARLEGRTRRLVLVPLLFLGWANLHGAFVVGLVLVALFLVEALLTEARRRPFAAALIAAAAASQLNPAAGGALGWAVAYAATPAALIIEERPPDILGGPGLVFAVLLLTALGAALVLGREGVTRAVGAPLLWPVLLVPFALLGLAIQRQLPLACMILAPFLAAALPAALGRRRVAAPRLKRSVGLGLCIAFVCCAGVVAALFAPRAPDLAAYPAAALPYLRPGSGNILNEYDWGGYLIHAAPGTPVFIDGRGALLFSWGVQDDLERAVHVRPGFRDPLSAWDIRLVLLRPGRPLVEVLQADGWRTLARGDRFVLLERP